MELSSSPITDFVISPLQVVFGLQNPEQIEIYIKWSDFF